MSGVAAKPDVRIPYVDLALQHRALRDELIAAAARVLDHGRFILGPEVEEFEQRFAEICGVRHAIGVNSGTDAIMLALRALGVGPGDEVVTAANTFVATVSAIVLVGAQPVLVDVGDDYNLDASLLEAAVTERTRAILPVHLTGQPADMGPIEDVARRHELGVVEDAAQSVLARYRGRPVGALGDIGCFSLHPLKTLNACGDGGVLTTDDDGRAELLRKLRNLGLRSRGVSDVWSGNSRLDTIQAALLLVKLRYVEDWTERRRAHAERYRAGLAGLAEVALPVERPADRAVYHTFVVQAEERDSLRDHLLARGIETAVHYPEPVHLQPAAATLGYSRGDFPRAERQAERIVSLPIYPELTPEQIDDVVDAVRAFYAR